MAVAVAVAAQAHTVLRVWYSAVHKPCACRSLGPGTSLDVQSLTCALNCYCAGHACALCAQATRDVVEGVSVLGGVWAGL